MAIDITRRKPVFENITAGLSGPAIRPIALRIIWELFDILNDANTQVPIIGIGGIACTQDALEFLMAGAAAIQVGSATFVYPKTMTDIIDGIYRYMNKTGMSSIGEISIKGKLW